MNFKVEKVIPDKPGKLNILKWLEEKVIVLVNIYAPNDVAQEVSFFKRLNLQLEEFAQDTIVIGGDFYCALTSNDKRVGKPVSKKSTVTQEINTLCDLYNLSDIWRILSNGKQCFTWRTKSFKMPLRPFLSFARVNLISKEMRHRPRTRIWSLRSVTCFI